MQVVPSLNLISDGILHKINVIPLLTAFHDYPTIVWYYWNTAERDVKFNVIYPSII